MPIDEVKIGLTEAYCSRIRMVRLLVPLPQVEVGLRCIWTVVGKSGMKCSFWFAYSCAVWDDSEGALGLAFLSGAVDIVTDEQAKQ